MADEKLVSAQKLFLSLRDDPEINGKNLARVRKHISEAPTVDAVEVVHGQWRRFINGDGEYKYLCGVCEKMVTYEMGGSNYCPNCGAKMDGEADA